MENPLVSIITITLNRADLIHRCIESIQKQTYSNFEHIIVDGNSTDNTEEVVKSYKDPRIKYIKLKVPKPSKKQPIPVPESILLLTIHTKKIKRSFPMQNGTNRFLL